MATNPEPMSDAEVKATRRQVTNLMRHPIQHHPNQGALIHYALDLESPPVIACEAQEPGVISSPTASEVTCPLCMETEHFPRSVAIQPETSPEIRGYDVMVQAALLLSEEGENPEYDRAILELTSALIGAGPDDSILMTRILRALKQGA